MLGVPNRGLENIETMLAVTYGQKNNELLQNLGPNSTYLKELDYRFSKLVQEGDINIIVVYELRDSPSVEVRIYFVPTSMQAISRSSLSTVQERNLVTYRAVGPCRSVRLCRHAWIGAEDRRMELPYGSF